MPVAAALIGTGTLPIASETPFITHENQYGIVYGNNDECYVSTDWLTFELTLTGIDAYPFGVTDSDSVVPGGGFLFYSNARDDLEISAALETLEYVNDRTLGDHYFATGATTVFIYDAATEWLYQSTDGGVTFDAGTVCDFNFAYPFSVTQNQIVYFNETFHTADNSAYGFTTGDLQEWISDVTIPGGYFCVTADPAHSVWSIAVDAGSETVSITYSTDTGDLVEFLTPYTVLSFPGLDSVKAVSDGDGGVLLYVFTDTENFSLYQLSITSAIENGGQSGNQGATGGGVNGAGGAVGFSRVTTAANFGHSVESLAYPAGIVAVGNDFGIDLGL